MVPAQQRACGPPGRQGGDMETPQGRLPRGRPAPPASRLSREPGRSRCEAGEGLGRWTPRLKGVRGSVAW